MFADFKGSARRDYGIRMNGIENSLIKNHGLLGIPMPALGEAICKIRDKCKDRASDVLLEMNRLMDKGIITPYYIQNAQETYGLASRVSIETEDDRDQISPMDALIVAAAAVDPKCSVLYTTDSTILTDVTLSEMIDGWREDKGYKNLAIQDISGIIKK